MNQPPAQRGIVHGKTIELDHDAGLPDGQPVTVIVLPVAETASTGVGLERSFGGWDDGADDLDRFLDWNRQQRKQGRKGLAS